MSAPAHLSPEAKASLPRHVAIIMDGNGRWAKERHLPRIEGHRAGAESARTIIRTSGELGIKYLTLYAFSVENWNRPKDEVDALMKYLVHYLKTETSELNKNNVRLEVIVQLDPPDITEQVFAQHLYTRNIPDPDLLIRTSGEMRVSNFLLWQISYSELYVTETLWPDFRKPQLIEALED